MNGWEEIEQIKLVKGWNKWCKNTDDCCNCEIEDICDTLCSSFVRLADYIDVDEEYQPCSLDEWLNKKNGV